MNKIIYSIILVITVLSAMHIIVNSEKTTFNIGILVLSIGITIYSIKKLIQSNGEE